MFTKIIILLFTCVVQVICQQDIPRFGDSGQFQCHCLNPLELCGDNSASCESCPPGWKGPGCNVHAESGPVAIVVVLAVLLTFSMITSFVTVIVVSNVITSGDKKNITKNVSIYSVNGNGLHTKSISNSIYGTRLSSTRPEVPRIAPNDLEMTDEKIGEGRFGTMYKGQLKDIDDSFTVCVKTLEHEDNRRQFLAQLDVYSAAPPHDNILQFYGFTVINSQILAAFEYCEMGQLRLWLRTSVPNHLQVKKREQLLRIAHGVCKGMEHLTNSQIVHGELCAHHIFLTQTLVPRIAGLNIYHGQQGETGNKAMPTRWLAPEVLRMNEPTSFSDVWSYGVTLWEIMSMGVKPYNEIETKNLGRALEGGHRMNKPEYCSDAVYGLMRWCWTMDPFDRPSFYEIAKQLYEISEAGPHLFPGSDSGLYMEPISEECGPTVPDRVQYANLRDDGIQNDGFDNDAENVPVYEEISSKSSNSSTSSATSESSSSSNQSSHHSHMIITDPVFQNLETPDIIITEAEMTQTSSQHISLPEDIQIDSTTFNDKNSEMLEPGYSNINEIDANYNSPVQIVLEPSRRSSSSLSTTLSSSSSSDYQPTQETSALDKAFDSGTYLDAASTSQDAIKEDPVYSFVIKTSTPNPEQPTHVLSDGNHANISLQSDTDSSSMNTDEEFDHLSRRESSQPLKLASTKREDRSKTSDSSSNSSDSDSLSSTSSSNTTSSEEPQRHPAGIEDVYANVN